MPDVPMKFADEFPPASASEWCTLVEKTLGGKPFNKTMFCETYDGIQLSALSTRSSAKISPQPVRRHGDWAVVSSHWINDAAQVNAEMLEDLERGASAVAVMVDTQGQQGITPGDLATAFDNVYLDMVPFTLITGCGFSQAATAMADLLDTRQYDPATVSGLLGIDPIGALARTGQLYTNADTAIETGADVAVQYAAKWPKIAAFVADGTVYSNAGATEAMELAAAISTAVKYLRTMEEKGMALNDAARHIQFTLSASSNLWLTIAKFRALRRLWQQILNACGVDDINARINAVSALHQTTMKDPWVNILRGTAACFGAAIGGADAVTVLPHDIMLGTTNKFSRKVARNVQIILQDESNLSKVTDPSAGSYALETLTHDLTVAAYAQFQDIENAGGILLALRDGTFKAKVDAVTQQRSGDVRKRKVAITGVSEFPNINETTSVDHGYHDNQPNERAGGYEYIDSNFALVRPALEFERWRFESDATLKESGARPRVFLANLGTPADFTARATYAKNLFEAGGIEAIMSAGAVDAVVISQSFTQSNAVITVLCGTDEQYASFGVEIIAALKAAGAKRIYLAGKLNDSSALNAAGLDECIFMGCDIVDAIEHAYVAIGINARKSGENHE